MIYVVPMMGMITKLAALEFRTDHGNHINQTNHS